MSTDQRVNTGERASDYNRLIDEITRLGGECVGLPAWYDELHCWLEPWRLNGIGLIIACNNGPQVGLYAFVGRDGAPIEEDIKFLHTLAHS